MAELTFQCRVCGNTDVHVDYNNALELLKCRCKRCGNEWSEEPLFAREQAAEQVSVPPEPIGGVAWSARDAGPCSQCNGIHIWHPQRLYAVCCDCHHTWELETKVTEPRHAQPEVPLPQELKPGEEYTIAMTMYIRRWEELYTIGGSHVTSGPNFAATANWQDMLALRDWITKQEQARRRESQTEKGADNE